MTEYLLDVKGLRVKQTSKNLLFSPELVKGIDIQVPQGKVVGIIGESGSGKSISMKSVMNILPDPVVASMERFYFQGKEVKEGERLPLAMIFQDPMTSLNPLRTISFHLAEIIFRNDEEITDQDAEELAISVLRQVGISEPEKRLNQYPFEFSGGMRQRILIAMALLANPLLLIADEPTTALDVTIQLQILSLLKKLQKEKDLSIILVSHDFGVIAGMCDYVKVMYKGRIVEEGTVEEIFYSPQHPYTQRLLKAADLDKDQEELETDLLISEEQGRFEQVSSTHRYLVEV